MIAERLASKSGLLRVASPSARNDATNEDLSKEARNSRATAKQLPSLKALALLALSRNSRATTTQQDAEQDRKTTQQTVGKVRAFVAHPVAPMPSGDSVALLRVARDATAQQITRTVVKFRLPGGCPNSWCSAIGTRSRNRIIAQLHDLHGDAVEVLP